VKNENILTIEERRNLANEMKLSIIKQETELDFICRLAKEVGQYPENGTLLEWLDGLKKKQERLEKMIIRLQLNGVARRKERK